MNQISLTGNIASVPAAFSAGDGLMYTSFRLRVHGSYLDSDDDPYSYAETHTVICIRKLDQFIRIIPHDEQIEVRGELRSRTHVLHIGGPIAIEVAYPFSDVVADSITWRDLTLERTGTKGGLSAIEPVARRNKRSVWTIAAEASAEAHFATFPTKLVEPRVLAGTSERGCCANCGAPWKRITERAHSFQSGSGRAGNPPSGKFAGTVQAESGAYDIRMRPLLTTRTVSWEPTCSCGNTVKPCTVLDPFNGAGTTGLVALRLGRNYTGIELNPEYVAMSERRLREDAPLFRQEKQP